MTRTEAEAAGWTISSDASPRWHGDDRVTWIGECRGSVRRDMAYSLEDLLEQIDGYMAHRASRGLVS